MNQFYVEPSRIFENHFELTHQEARHAAQVMRYHKGDRLTATDGRGNRFSGTVTSIGRDVVQVQKEKVTHSDPPEPEITLALGLIKKRQRLEFAIEKAVELGTSNILLFESCHTERSRVRLDRLRDKAISAMKQSLRVWLPEIRHLTNFESVFDTAVADNIYLAHATYAPNPASEINNDNASSLLLLVGPEGDFSEEEVALSVKKGAQKISLGSYRLRTETAAVCLLSQLL